MEAGLAQNRERTYIIGIFNEFQDELFDDFRNNKISNLKKEFKCKGFNFFDTLIFNNEQKYIVDVLDDVTDKKYNISNENVIEYLRNIDMEYNGIREKKIVKLFDLPREVWNDLERQRRVYSIYGISPTILARSDTTKILLKKDNEYLIRKLTPKENFRLQGFSEEFIENIFLNNNVSITQLYKQSGNAVSPPIISGIINHLYLNYIRKKNKYTFIDLFCGLGGFRIALENLGLKCLFSSDIDENVKRVYEKNFKDIVHGDITKISTKDIPEHDLLVAGFPCQPFSTAGKRLGFEDTRGTLFFEVARILKEKKPKSFILENVKGIINHNSGQTLKIILNILNEIGYSYKYEILNAKDYGIAQNRERWYCVGFRKDLGINIDDFLFPNKEVLERNILDVIENDIDEENYRISSICKNNMIKHIEKKNIQINEYTLASDIRPSRCNFNNKGYANCLTAKMGTGGSNVPVLVKKERKLTERECLRLMGFPESYEIEKGYQAYKQIGNSVVVSLIEKIAFRVLEVLKKCEI